MPDPYDAVVIGSGPAGQNCARGLARGGLRVAIVERELVGGECDYWACMPSKTLLRPGQILAEAGAAPGAREAVGGSLDVAQALGWRDYMVSGWDDGEHARALVEAGVELWRGEGRIGGPGVVLAGERELAAREIVVATGSEATLPPVDGLRELEGVWTNREATALKQVPRSLLVLGGGPVGVELAQALHRFGARVTLVESADHLLPREPAALGEGLGEALRADGIEVVTGVAATSARREGGGAAGGGRDPGGAGAGGGARLAGGESESAAGGGERATGGDFVLALDDGSERRAERLLVATGRRPRVAGIGLEAVGIEPDPKGLLVDAQLRTPAEGVWAVGDVTGIWPLTYVGTYQARVATANILAARRGDEAQREARYDAVPRVVFTDPQAASVGAAEGAASATVKLAEAPRTSTWLRDYTAPPWFVALVTDGERLTGAHALGPEAGEWLQQATLAIRARIPLDLLEDTIQPFPTFAEVFRFALAELLERL
jgi:pyruvate/2-oxoglutarate dehydrogenase complex dihydrolipoamide dehydrogenase (E3) component